MAEIVRKYLFVCLANIDRSKTAEIVFKDLFRQNGYFVRNLEEQLPADFYVGSAGVKVEKYGNHESRQYSREIGNLAEIIFAMDPEIVFELKHQDSHNLRKVICLNIPDVYDTEHEQDYRQLVEIFNKKFVDFLPKNT